MKLYLQCYVNTEHGPILKKMLVFDGINSSQIQNDYGENDFSITYKDSLVASFRHFKTLNKQIDTYSFHVFKSGNQLKLQVTIKGTDPKKFTINFTEKSH